MSNDLHRTLESLASQFAHDVLLALRGASLEDIVAESRPGHAGAAKKRPAAEAAAPARRARGAGRRKGGRLKRRSPDQLEKVLASVVTLLKQNPKGLRGEEIQKKLGLARKELARPVAHGLGKKALRKKGEKRATTYFAA